MVIMEYRMANKQAVPIIITSPEGYVIPMSSLEMTANFFRELVNYTSGTDIKYLDYKQIRFKLDTGDTTFASGPLKGWSFIQHNSYEEQRKILFNAIPSVITARTLVKSSGVVELKNSRLKDQKSNGVVELKNSRLKEEKSNGVVEEQSNRGECQPTFQPNSQPTFHPTFHPNSQPNSQPTVSEFDTVFADSEYVGH